MKNLKKIIAPIIGFTAVASIAIVGAVTFNNSGINKVSAESVGDLDNSVVSKAILYCGHTNDNTDEHLHATIDGKTVDVGAAAITQRLNFDYEIYDNKKNGEGGKTLKIWFGDADSKKGYESLAGSGVKFVVTNVNDSKGIFYNNVVGQTFDYEHPLYIDLISSKTVDQSHQNADGSFYSDHGNEITMDFALESDSFGCAAHSKYVEYQNALNIDNANGNTNAQNAFFQNNTQYSSDKKLYEYGISGFLVSIPDLTGAAVNNPANPQYNTLCKALRHEGNDDGKGGKYITTKVYEQYNDAFKDKYLDFLPYCGSTTVDGVLSDADLQSLIESTILLVNAQNSSSTAGDNGNHDHNFNFENVRDNAIDNDNGYYIDDKDNWYKLDKSTCLDGNKHFNVNSCTHSDKATFTSNNNVFSLKCKYVVKGQYSSGNHAKDGVFVDDFSYLRQTKNGSYNITANTTHYYAYKTDYVAGESYIFHYAGSGYNDLLERDTGSGAFEGPDTSQSTGKCKKTCEETVEVNYGPPIASSAGLCFEYEVEVISRVRCSTSTTDIHKPKRGDVCLPTPICNNIPGFIHQAGPIEEYESCINDCDGGKYTKSCSNKCYDKVYGKLGNSVDSSKMASYRHGNIIMSKVAHIGSANGVISFDGYYIKKKENNIAYIYWISTDPGFDNEGSYNRYYEKKEYWKTLNDDHSYTYGGSYRPVNGFKTHIEWNGSLCQDHCYNQGCTDDKLYLNEEDAEADFVNNMKIYNRVISKCVAAASCENKTATFKISVNYTTVTSSTKENECKLEDKTIDFPITSSTSQDMLKSSEKDEEGSCSGKNYLNNNSKSVILDYDGCYKTCGMGSWYYTKWSFPGTWLYPKKGKISWEEPKVTSGWRYEPDKFCLPLNIANTNVTYWKYYHSHLNENDIPSYKNGNPYAGDSMYPDVDAAKPVYNINASTANFGAFGWNINVGCFYSSYDETVEDSNSNSKLPKCDRDLKVRYKIRTVDLTDLFPSKDGTESTDSSKYSTDINEVPFNWTDKASSTKVQVPGVAANPEVYGKYVQTKGYDIYNDDELEYQFHLTPTIMKEFRQSSSCVDNGVYDDNKVTGSNGVGTVTASSTVLAYKSKCFREGGKLANSVKKIPDSKLLGCNNISSGKCVQVH